MGTRISDDKTRTIEYTDVLNIVSDECMMRILVNCDYKSVRLLSTKLNIPLATCYRKVRYLRELGLLKVVGHYTTNNGNTNPIYSSVLTRLYVGISRKKHLVVLLQSDDKSIGDIYYKIPM